MRTEQELEQALADLRGQLADLERRFDAHVSATSNLAEAVRLAGEMIEAERTARQLNDASFSEAIARTDESIARIWQHIANMPGEI